MDLTVDELMLFRKVIKELINIPKQAPKTFTLISLTLILPLSFAFLAHSIFTVPLLDLIVIQGSLSTRRQWTQFIILQFGYPVLLFAFSLLSTASVVFTVASIYTFRPVSFISTLSAIPPVFKRIFITFLFVSALLILSNVIFLIFCYLLSLVNILYPTFLCYFCFTIFFTLFLSIYTYITVVWHLASIISILEPMYGRAAMKKSMELLKGKMLMAMLFVLLHLQLCCLIEWLFEFAMLKSWKIKASLGALLIVSMAIVNLVGLLVQSIFYYVCKVYHNEKVDKNELQQHLGGYVGEFLPLNSTINIELKNQSMEAADM